jgi:hypothetical protein
MSLVMRHRGRPTSVSADLGNGFGDDPRRRGDDQFAAAAGPAGARSRRVTGRSTGVRAVARRRARSSGLGGRALARVSVHADGARGEPHRGTARPRGYDPAPPGVPGGGSGRPLRARTPEPRRDRRRGASGGPTRERPRAVAARPDEPRRARRSRGKR